MTGADTYLTHTLFDLLHALHYLSIPEIVFGKRHDPGQVTYLTQKTEDNIIVKDKIKLKTDKKFS